MKTLSTILILVSLVGCGQATEDLAQSINKATAAATAKKVADPNNGTVAKETAPAAKKDPNEETIADSNTESSKEVTVSVDVKANASITTNTTVNVTSVVASNAVAAPVNASAIAAPTVATPDEVTGTWITQCDDGVVEKRVFQGGLETVTISVYSDTSCTLINQTFTQNLAYKLDGDKIDFSQGDTQTYQTFQVDGGVLILGAVIDSDNATASQDQIYNKI